MVEKGVYFIAGVYGVGKTTLCDFLSEKLNCPSFSASDLISKKTNEKYGANKSVTDKENNQNVLINAVNEILDNYPQIILAGHFCIFNKENQVEKLPEFVYKALHIKKIVLLEADINTIRDRLNERDHKEYTLESIQQLRYEEKQMAAVTAQLIGCPLLIHQMSFSESDIENISGFLQMTNFKGGNSNACTT